MNNSQFIIFLAARLGCSTEMAEQYVSAIVKWITDNTIANTQLVVRDFGKFLVEKRNEYIVVDAITRKRTLMPPHLSMHFVPYPLLGDEEKGLFFPMEQVAGEMANKLQVPANVAEMAVVEFFKALLHAMNNEGEVSVEALGVFQLTKVKLNNSVYGKVSFRSDSALSDIVNRPFSYFQPVELRDDVHFEDVETTTAPTDSSAPASDTFVMETITENTDAKDQEDSNGQEGIIEQEDAIEQENAIEQEGIIEQEDDIEQEDAKVPVALNALNDSNESNDPEDSNAPIVLTPSSSQETSVEKNVPKRNYTGLIVLLGVVALIGLVILFFGRSNDEETGVASQTTESSSDSVKAILPVDTMAPKEAIASADTIDLDAMNAKIPYGAYDIVGIDTVITVVKGQTAASLSMMMLGADNPIYLIVANDGNDNPQPGEKYRIPKLQLRK